jgi:hypothetical protein
MRSRGRASGGARMAGDQEITSGGSLGVHLRGLAGSFM